MDNLATCRINKLNEGYVRMSNLRMNTPRKV
ncbi:hypothetical protein HNQ92_001103 [Rhabdobacter roseus]|uniref:Uncharacterized protein n=1 Tax=Rhabdobacter roseus TaxID=1655419 RepID=A0A840TMI6_9BACT|nr:hypothetical protein [Rhabdobacter roseus]